jgi:hypothetical protein
LVLSAHGCHSTKSNPSPGDQGAFYLLSFLRANQGPNATFMVANGLSEIFGLASEADRRGTKQAY